MGVKKQILPPHQNATGVSLWCGGLFFAVFAGFIFAFLFFVQPAKALGWNPSRLVGLTNLPTGGGEGIFGIIYNLMQWILGIFGIIGVIGFVISGIMYLTSAGSEDQITKAKSAMKWSLVGVVVGLIGLVIIRAVDEWLGGWNRTF